MYVSAVASGLGRVESYREIFRREPQPPQQNQNGTGSPSDGQPPQQNNSSSDSSSPGMAGWSVAIVIAVVVILLIAVLIYIYSYLRRQRLQGKEPKFIPGAYLKGKWRSWKPKGKYNSLEGQDGSSMHGPTEQVTQSATTVDRHTSVRSVITLPAYSRTPKDHEEVIGREGERAGMDTVVEFPETVDEEETRREEEMESLYQIRLTRRQEIADREERRRQRREARDAGDYTRLEQLRLESRQRRDQQNLLNPANRSTATLTAEALIADYNARGRDRRVSSVSYAAVGQVRHDGSRIRAGSKDSERGGLLESAAPMGDVPPLPHTRDGSDAISMLTIGELPRLRYRDRSDSGAISVSSFGSSFDNVSRHEIRPTTAGTVAASQHTTQSVSDVESEEADIVDETVEPATVLSDSSPLPPNYDAIDWGDAPEYTEAERVARMNSTASVYNQVTAGTQATHPVSDQPPRPPTLQVTPTIHIQGPSMPNSPAVAQQADR